MSAKWMRREKKLLRRKNQMRVSGKSVFTIQAQLIKRAKGAKWTRRNY